MTSTATLTLLVIGSIVWGGFSFFAVLALRREGARRGDREPVETIDGPDER